MTNPPGQDPTGGILSVASYFDQATGNRDGAVSDIGTFNTISGTSMASPHIAGIVARLFQTDPTATPAEIEAALKSTTYHYADGAAYTSVGGYSTSFDKGTGLVDVMAAVAALTS